MISLHRIFRRSRIWLKRVRQRFAHSDHEGLVQHTVVRRVPVKGRIVFTYETYYAPANTQPPVRH